MMTRKRKCKQNENPAKLVAMEINNSDSPEIADPELVDHVMNIPLILENILNKLSAYCLNTCARVCKEWHRTVRSIQKKRKHITSHLYDGCKDLDTIGEEIKNLATEPGTVIAFYTATFTEEMKDHCEFWQYFQRQLPNDCMLAAVATDGICGTSLDMKRTEEIESDIGMSAITFPKLNGVEIKTFIMTEADILGERHAAKNTPCPDPVETEWAVHTNCRGDEDVKLVILFYTDHQVPAEVEMGYTFMKMYKNVVVAGGFVDRLMEEHLDGDKHQYDDEEPTLRGITISGKDVKVASTIISHNINTADNLIRKLRQLQDANITGKNRIAFQFSCIGRGSYHYGKPNVEADTFRKLFPDVPLQGFFGNGEIGYDFIPDYSKPDPFEGLNVVKEEKKKDGRVLWTFPKIHHSYTSVFVMVSFGTLTGGS